MRQRRILRRTAGVLAIGFAVLLVVAEFAPVRAFVLTTNQATYELFVGRRSDFSIYRKAPVPATSWALAYRPPLDPNPPPVVINGKTCCASLPYHKRSRPANLLGTDRYEFSLSSFAILPFGVGIALLVTGLRRRIAGDCRCGYNLTGNVSGVCPECGMSTERAADGARRGQSPNEVA